MRCPTLISTLLPLLFVALFPLAGNANITEFLDFDNNQLPSGWYFQSSAGNVGIVDGKLQAQAGSSDALVTIRKDFGTAGVTRINVEFDAALLIYNEIFSWAMFDIHTRGDDFQFGDASGQQFIYGDRAGYVEHRNGSFPEWFPTTFDSHHYVGEFRDGYYSFRATQIDSPANEIFGFDVNDQSFIFDGTLESIDISLYITGSGSTNTLWLDNVLIEITVIPIPSAFLLLGSGLIGLVGVRKIGVRGHPLKGPLSKKKLSRSRKM